MEETNSILAKPSAVGKDQEQCEDTVFLTSPIVDVIGILPSTVTDVHVGASVLYKAEALSPHPAKKAL